jgi:hypothetical protein
VTVFVTHAKTPPKPTKQNVPVALTA